MQIRNAKPDDITAIVRLNASLFQEDAGQRDPFTNLHWPEVEGDEHFAELVANEDSLCLLAEVDRARVIGYLVGYMKEQTDLRPINVAEMESMYVQEDYRNQGVGTSLTTDFLAWANERGADRASVTAFAENDRAIEFYQRSGFEPMKISLEAKIG
jgi:ribosomal protein S18 acetylase RimI-like enzyme